MNLSFLSRPTQEELMSVTHSLDYGGPYTSHVTIIGLKDQCLIDMVQRRSHATTLTLNGATLGAVGCAMLKVVFMMVTELNLVGCKISGDGYRELLENDFGIETLRVSHAKADESDFRLADALAHSTALKTFEWTGANVCARNEPILDGISLNMSLKSVIVRFGAANYPIYLKKRMEQVKGLRVDLSYKSDEIGFELYMKDVQVEASAQMARERDEKKFDEAFDTAMKETAKDTRTAVDAYATAVLELHDQVALCERLKDTAYETVSDASTHESKSDESSSQSSSHNDINDQIKVAHAAGIQLRKNNTDPARFPENTLGFQLNLSDTTFGKDSVPSRFLHDMIWTCPNEGMQRCYASEDEMIKMLETMVDNKEFYKTPAAKTISQLIGH